MNTEKPVQPIIKKSRRTYLFAWLIPLAVAVLAGYYAHEMLFEKGPLITIRLNEASGIRADETPLFYRGVEIGRVTEVRLSEDRRKVLALAHLHRDQGIFAAEGAAFWVVRPQISETGLTGLNTILSGPYIDSTPGSSANGIRGKTEFNVLEQAPQSFGEGTELILASPRLTHLESHSPIYYRGIQVGAVRSIELAHDGDHVDARATIWRKYAGLVHAQTKFWQTGGFEAKGGIFSGIDIRLGSLQSLVTGGIAFATPDKEMGPEAQNGEVFAVADSPEKDWLQWAPRLPVGPGAPQQAGERARAFPTGQDLLDSAGKGK